MTYKIAVTGVGGGSGQGILKALLQSPIPMDIYAIDVQPMSAGLFWPGVEHVLLPKPEENIEAWKMWAAENKINLIIPGADRDLAPLAAVASSWRKDRICRVGVSSPYMIQTADDKLDTYSALNKLGLPSPVSCWESADVSMVNSWARHLYPVVVKPRRGAASRGMYICQNEEELDFYWWRTGSPIVQEYLEGDEYTCSIFFDVDCEPVAQFAMRRWLRSGDTHRAEVVNDERINGFLHDFGVKLKRGGFLPFGAINVQFKDTADRGPVIFEINARCSGTTAIRAHFGYNEPEMLVKHICQRLPISQPKTKTGFAFRHMEELYLDGMTETEIMERGYVEHT